MAAILISAFAVSNHTALAFDTDFYSGNDILFYTPDDTGCSTNVSASTTSIIGSSLPAATIQFLDTLKIKDKIEQNKKRYLDASSATGVPWQAIAALHYREASLDPTRSIYNGQLLAQDGKDYINSDGRKIVSDPSEDAKNAANALIEMAKSVYKVDPSSQKMISSGSVQDWGEAFLAYNRGYIYKWANTNYDKSPYVMNGYDNQYLNMSWPSMDREPLKGKDSNMGALTIMAYLGGIDLNSNCEPNGSGVIQGNIVKTAIGLALDHTAEVTDPSMATASYRQAIVSYDKSTATYPEITDCGRFVATVIRSSGVDANFPPVSVGSEMIPYMNENTDKYTSLGEIGSAIRIDQLKPGDIIANGGHILLYTGDNNGYLTAQASLYGQVPNVRSKGDSLLWLISEKFNAWRVKL